MEEFDLYLDGRLRVWGAWQYRIENCQEGWPTSSLLSIVMELGTLVRNNGRSRPPMSIANEMAHETNTWINRMGSIHPLYKDAVYAWYVHCGKTQKELAKEREISVSAFKQRVHHARVWLSGRLSADLSPEELSERTKGLPKNENKYLHRQAV